ncbi:MAG TPA: alpha/beta hydrolase [Rhizobiaceae bacterium]|nr:alpha/beta hydrolase [Rhizobiaceae bacterium]
MLHGISDWDNAYANGANIPRGDAWPDLWLEPSKSYRDRLGAEGRAKLDLPYGDGERHRFDVFMPKGSPKGLVVFIHGGYWMRFDKSVWSHLANGSVESGYAVAMPSYTLCPDIRLGGIVAEIGKAVTAIAGQFSGPIHLTGHSAGGHLAACMITANSPLPAEIRKRIANVVAISGLHDLRPLMRTGMNATLRLDEAEALATSPALLRPMENARITCWVGAGERAEFIRQNELLANIWIGLGAKTEIVEEPDRHHFTIIDGLTDPNHVLTKTLLSS